MPRARLRILLSLSAPGGLTLRKMQRARYSGCETAAAALMMALGEDPGIGTAKRSGLARLHRWMNGLYKGAGLSALLRLAPLLSERPWRSVHVPAPTSRASAQGDLTRLHECGGRACRREPAWDIARRALLRNRRALQIAAISRPSAFSIASFRTGLLMPGPGLGGEASGVYGEGDDGAEESVVAGPGRDLESEAQAGGHAGQDALRHDDAVHHPLPPPPAVVTERWAGWRWDGPALGARACVPTWRVCVCVKERARWARPGYQSQSRADSDAAAWPRPQA